MFITEVKFYQMPYNYFSNDRFYKKGTGDIVLPDPIRIITSNSINTYDEDITTITENFSEQLSFIKNTLLISFMNISGDVNFNYIEITSQPDEETTTETETNYWFVMSNELVREDYNKLTLKKDIFTSMELIKSSELDETIKIGRKLYDNFNITNDGTTIEYKTERNPHIWNNNEFNQLLPQNKVIKPFELTSGITVGLDPDGNVYKFENGGVQFKVPKRLKDVEITMKLRIPQYTYYQRTGYVQAGSEDRVVKTNLSPLFSILNEIIQTTNYKTPGSKLSHLATFNEEYVNDELSVYTATTLRPIIYNNASRQFIINPSEWFSWELTRTVGNYDQRESDEYIGGSIGWYYHYYWNTWFNQMITKDIEDWKKLFRKHISTTTDDDGTLIYKCPWNKEVSLEDPNFLAILKYILSTFINNTQESFSGSETLKSVDAYTHWTPLNLDLYDPNDPDYDIDNNITMFCPSVRDELITNRVVQGRFEYIPSETVYNINKHLEPYATLSSKQNLNKKVEHIINDDLLTEWDKYKCLTPQLFSPTYDFNYIDIIGNQLPLDNYKLYNTSELLIKTWFGSGEQNISYYQGDLDGDNNIIEPRYVNKFAFTQPIEFSVDEKEKILALNKNRLDARIAETALAAQRDTNYFSATAKNKIDTAQSLTDSDIEEAKQNANTQKTLIKNLTAIKIKDAGANAVSSVIRDTATAAILTGGDLGKTLGAFAGSTISTGLNYANTKRSAGETLAAQNQAITSNTTTRTDALRRKNSANAAAYLVDQEINIARVESSAQSQLNLIQAEIADIKLTPNQTMNVSDITKMLSLDKGEISISNETLNDIQQKEMFKFWNKNGIKNWKSISTKGNWYNEFSLYDYFQGGDWTKYLNDIGVFNIEVIQEFNTLMANGLRLQHQSQVIYDKIIPLLDDVDNIFDINNDTPNWPVPIIDVLIDPVERARIEQLEADRIEQERIERQRLIDERDGAQSQRLAQEDAETERLAESARELARARRAEAIANQVLRQRLRIERQRGEETDAERAERAARERAEREEARRELRLATLRTSVAEKQQELDFLTSSTGIIDYAKSRLGIAVASGGAVASAGTAVAASAGAAAATSALAAGSAAASTAASAAISASLASGASAAVAQGAGVAAMNAAAASAVSATAASTAASTAATGPVGVAIALIIGVVGTRLYMSELRDRRNRFINAEINLLREELSIAQSQATPDLNEIINIQADIVSREEFINIVRLGEEARRQ